MEKQVALKIGTTFEITLAENQELLKEYAPNEYLEIMRNLWEHYEQHQLEKEKIINDYKEHIADKSSIYAPVNSNCKEYILDRAKLVARYTRISPQKNIEETLEKQEEELQEYVKKNNYIVVENYIDLHKGGYSEETPALKRLIEDINNNKIDTVIVMGGLDRLSRNNEIIMQIVDKVNVICIENGVETLNSNKPIGLEIQVDKTVFNEYYRKELSNKIKKGIALSKEKKKSSK